MCAHVHIQERLARGIQTHWGPQQFNDLGINKNSHTSRELLKPEMEMNGLQIERVEAWLPQSHTGTGRNSPVSYQASTRVFKCKNPAVHSFKSQTTTNWPYMPSHIID